MVKNTRPGRGGVAFLLLVAAIWPAMACSDLARESPLANARTSSEALGRAALAAVTANDEETLSALMITRDEYETLLWPSLPDRDQMPFEFVWSLTGPRSRKARRAVLEEYGGLALELVEVDLGEDVETYEGFALYREARMTIRRTDTGQVGTFPLMDVLVFMGGGWKFLNYAEDL